MKDLSRSVSMNCDVCGSEVFNQKKDVYTCNDCGKKFLKEELIQTNQYKINKNIEDMEKDVINETKKKIKKMLK